MNTITGTITREWLARIISGKKRYEWRGSSDFWENRVKKAGPPPFRFRLINGMKKDAPEATVLVSEVNWDDAAVAIKFTIDRVLETRNWKTEWTRLHSDEWTDEEEALPVPTSRRSPVVQIPVPQTLFRTAERGDACSIEVPTDGDLFDFLNQSSDPPFVVRLTSTREALDVVVQNLLTPFFFDGPARLVVSGRLDAKHRKP
jgi:hypothetical protein